MASQNDQDPAARAQEVLQSIAGGLARPGSVPGWSRGGMALAQQTAVLARTGGLHAVQPPPPPRNDGLKRAENSVFMDGEWIATPNIVGSGDFGHTVTVQWLTSITEGSPDGTGQEPVTGSDGDKDENIVGLGIRHISQSRFNYALSTNPSSDFLGSKTPVGLGIRQIPKNRFEYALSANPNADFLGDRPPIGLGISHLPNSEFDYTLSAHPSSELVGRDQMLGLSLLPEESSNAHYGTVKSPGPVLSASPPSSIENADESGVVHNPSPQISAENVSYFTERHSLHMSAKKKGKGPFGERR